MLCLTDTDGLVAKRHDEEAHCLASQEQPFFDFARQRAGRDPGGELERSRARRPVHAQRRSGRRRWRVDHEPG
jgi:hypothetical protein